MASPRILVVGMGSIGTVYGMLLWRAKAQLVCLCRSNYDLARAEGYTVHSTCFGDQNFRPVVVRSVAEAAALSNDPFDFVLVCTKVLPESTPTVASSIRPVVHSKHTSIIIIQNGIGIENEYSELYPLNPIISGVAYTPTSRISPVIISHTETQKLHVGTFPSKGVPLGYKDCATSFATLINAGGGDATVHEDVQIERWRKLISNATWNSVCALSQCRDLEFLQTTDLSTDFVLKAMQEVVYVAHSVGYGAHVDAGAVQTQFERSLKRTWPGVEPSMMTDMRKGLSMEVDAVIGEVVRLGKREGVEVPRLETLYVLLAGLDWAQQHNREVLSKDSEIKRP